MKYYREAIRRVKESPELSEVNKMRKAIDFFYATVSNNKTELEGINDQENAETHRISRINSHTIIGNNIFSILITRKNALSP